MRRLGWWCFLGILILVALAVDCWAAQTAPAAKSAANKPNIILITLDSARADRMGFLGSPAALTPTLDGIAHQGIVFSQAYAQAPLTVASHATILTGTYPQVHRAGEFGTPLEQRLPYLPYLLHLSGYRTAAFVGSILLDPASGPFQRYDRGFDVYDAAFHQPQRGESRYRSVARHADEVIARATKWLAGNRQSPFFLWVSLHDASIPDGTYDHAVAALDAATGKLMTFLRTQSLYDGAVIVIASVHGESLGAHGEDTHGIFLYEQSIHVPLLLKLPKNQMAGKQVKNRARLLDVAPTILEAAGIPVPSQMQGQSLLRIAQASSQADQPAYARSDLPQQGFQCSVLESWRAGKYLYIRAPKPELYDLSTDPNATRNLAQTSKATLDTLASQLQALDNHLGGEPGKESGAGAGLTSSEMQKLASLGYVGLQAAGAGVSAAAKGTDPKEIVAAANKTLAALRDLDDGQPEKAIPVLRQVLASQPDLYLAQYGMGAALFQQQHYAEAFGFLHKAIELEPESPWAHYTMGLGLIKTGDFQTSAIHLKIAARLLPGFAALHTTLSEVNQHLGRSQDPARAEPSKGRTAQMSDGECRVELGYLKNAHSVSSDWVAFNVRLRPTGQTLIGSSRQYRAEHKELHTAILVRMLEWAEQYMPGLTQMLAIRTWTGFRAATPDKFPLIDPTPIGPAPADKSLFHATGYEGLGITTSLVTARILAGQITGSKPETPIEPDLPARVAKEHAHA